MFKFQVSTKFSHIFSSTKDSSNSVMEIVNDNNVDEETPSATESAQQSVADRTEDSRPGIPSRLHYSAAQTSKVDNLLCDEHVDASGSNSAARATKHAKPASGSNVQNEKVIPKAELLDIEPDDDEIETWNKHDPWSDYFQSAQQTSETNTNAPKMTHESGTVRSSTNNNHKQEMDVLNLAEILDKLKLSERCKSPSLRQKLTDLVTMYQDRFAVNVGSTPAAISPFEIEVDESEWLQLKSEKYPRPQSAAREQAIRKFIRKAIADKVIRPSQASYFSQVLLTPKANGSWRFCVDYRNLNRITKRSGWTIPNIEGLLRKVGSHKAKYYASLDYTSGYHQAPLAESSRKYTAYPSL